MKNICILIKLAIIGLAIVPSYGYSTETNKISPTTNVNYQEIKNPQTVSLLKIMIFDIQKADTEIKEFAADNNIPKKQDLFWPIIKTKSYTNNLGEFVFMKVMFDEDKTTIVHALKSIYDDSDRKGRKQKGYKISYNKNGNVIRFFPRDKEVYRSISLYPNGNLKSFVISHKNVPKKDKNIAYLRYNQNNELEIEEYNLPHLQIDDNTNCQSQSRETENGQYKLYHK